MPRDPTDKQTLLAKRWITQLACSVASPFTNDEWTEKELRETTHSQYSTKQNNKTQTHNIHKPSQGSGRPIN